MDTYMTHWWYRASLLVMCWTWNQLFYVHCPTSVKIKHRMLQVKKTIEMPRKKQKFVWIASLITSSGEAIERGGNPLQWFLSTKSEAEETWKIQTGLSICSLTATAKNKPSQITWMA